MDVVLVVDDTGSMGPAINNVKAGLGSIITAALAASGGDLRMGLLSFADTTEVDQPFTSDTTEVTNEVNALFASGGGGEPESSDEAVRYAVTGASACAVIAPEGALGAFRSDCVKIIVLVTDARPAGCDDAYVDGVDDVNAAAAATAASAGGILISAVLVDNGSIPSGAHPGGVEPAVMSNYATTTGGVFTTVPADGTGTGAAIEDIIDSCGSAFDGDLDIKPGSCPNPYNAKAQGYLPVAILGTASFDVSTIDVGSVRISRADGVGGSTPPNQGPPGPGSQITDVGTPFTDELCDCHTLTGDGHPDLLLKFRRPDVTDALMLAGLPAGTRLELVVSFNTTDEVSHEVRDCIVIPAVGAAIDP